MDSVKQRLYLLLVHTAVSFAVFKAALATGSQKSDELKPSDRFVKSEYRIRMRDGTHLYTVVYSPKDTTKKYPLLISRTPYSAGPYGAEKFRDSVGPSKRFESAGYIVVYQDVRGKSMSEGKFVEVRPFLADDAKPGDTDEATDAYDTIEWLLANVPNHNGNAGLWGISYPGFYATGGLINAHPALKAVSPQAPIADWFAGDDWHRNGALLLVQNLKIRRPTEPSKPEGPPESSEKKNEKPLAQVRADQPPIDGYSFFLQLNPLAEKAKVMAREDGAFFDDMMRHGSYDSFWKARDIRRHLRNVRPAVMTVGGWYDCEDLFGALETYRQIEQNSPATTNLLVMGPWTHGAWSKPDSSRLGNIEFGTNTAEFYREQIEFTFFEKYLKGNDTPQLPEAYVFETGTNVWRKHDAWPPKSARPKSFYLGEQHLLQTDPPHDDSLTNGFDEFPSDPNRPVPFTEKVTMGVPVDFMTADQRFASRRPDVLFYQTEPLENDLTIVGQIQADLTVSTTGTDSDWIVKIIDVHPNNASDPQPNPTGLRMGGYQQLVRGDVMRGKFRQSLEKPEPFQPGQPTPVKLVMNDIYHTFRQHHRLMVQIQSTWFPLVDRNPQRFTDIYTATNADFQMATQKVFRTKSMSSRLELLVIP